MLLKKISRFLWRRCRPLYRAYWYIRHRTTDRFHVLHLGTKPGWSDVTERLVHANFMLLVDFVEKEKCFDVIAWDSDPVHKAAGDEIRALYQWYKNVRPLRDSLDPINHVVSPRWSFVPCEDVPGCSHMVEEGTPEQLAAWHKACMESHDFEMASMQEDDDMICRLAKIRRFLWT